MLAKSITMCLLMAGLVIAVLMVLKVVDDLDRGVAREEKLLIKAELLQAAGDHQKALTVYQEACKEGKCDATTLLKMGRLAVHAGLFSSGVTYCKEALLKTYSSPWPCSSPDALRCLLSSHLGLADPAEAAAYASKMRDCHLLSEAGKEVVAALQMAGDKDHQLQLLRALERNAITPWEQLPADSVAVAVQQEEQEIDPAISPTNSSGSAVEVAPSTDDSAAATEPEEQGDKQEEL